MRSWIELLGRPRNWSSRCDPLVGHVAHLRHLAKADAARLVLADRFGFSAADARQIANEVAPYVGRAIEFHEASQIVAPTIGSVTKYYCYLNLAVAAILAYRPANYSRYRTHGLSDRTHSLRRLRLSSRMVEVPTKGGASTLFHSILSRQPIANERLSLRELLVPFGGAAAELEQAFGLKTSVMSVDVGDDTPNEPNLRLRVRFAGAAAGPYMRPSRSQIERAFPQLRTDFTARRDEPSALSYLSRQVWARESADAREWRKRMLPFLNPGIRFDDGIQRIHSVVSYWNISPRVRILPAVSAAIMLAFSMASLARYRPALLRRAEDSRLNLLLETFSGEVDYLVIPAMRNLLYNEDVRISRIDTI